MLRSIGQLDFLDAGCEGCHVVELESDPADEVVEVALGEA